MKKQLLTVLAFFLFASTHANEQPATFEQAYAKAYQYQTDSIKLSITFALQAEQFALIEKNKENLGKAYWMLGYLYDIQGDIANAVNYYYGAAKIYDLQEKPNEAQQLIENIGSVAFENGLYDMAARAFTKRLDHSKKTKNNKTISDAHFDLGITYKKLREYDKAVSHLLTSARTLSPTATLADTSAFSKIYNELGIVNKMIAVDLNDPSFLDSSSFYYKKALHFDQSPRGQFYPTHNLGSIQLTMGNLDAAENYFLQALAISSKIQSEQIIIPTINNLGIIYFRRGQMDKADSLFMLAVTLNQKEYGPLQIIKDKKMEVEINNMEELLVSYAYLDSLATLGTMHEYAFATKMMKFSVAKNTLEAEELKNTIKVELAQIDKEIQREERMARIKNWIFFVLIFLFSSAIILYLYQRLQRFQRIKRNVLEEIQAIEQKFGF